MLIIPEQLKNQRVIMLADKNRPLEPQWNTVNNHAPDSTIFLEFAKTSTIYGVPTGFNNLIVLDFDDEEIYNKLKPHLPPTFTSLSANKKLPHLYYYTDDVQGRKFDDKETKKRLLDIQGKGQYVVGANSITPQGKKYEIVNDIPISTLYRADIDVAFKNANIDAIEVESLTKQQKKKQEYDFDIFLNPDAQKIKKELKVSQLLARFNIPIHKNPTMCPLGHDSQSKACFGFNDDTSQWHCFHCGKSGDIIHLYQHLYGFNNFRETKNAMFKELFIKQQEYEKAMINIQLMVRNKKTPAIGSFEIDAIANLLINQYTILTLKETDKIYWYNKETGTYVNCGDQTIQFELEKYFTDLMKTHIVNEILNKIKRITHKSVTVFNTYKNLICLKNGVFNFETKILVPHSPDYLFLNSIPVEYNSSARCPKIDKFFKEIYEQQPDLLYEICTFLLIKHNMHEKAIILVGQGKNGKSVYLGLCRAFIGEENISAESLQRLSVDKFSTSGLFGKMANISADIPSKEVASTDQFKTLVSGKDSVKAEFKGENSFKFVNMAKLLFSCNQLPAASDNTDGYLRKWCILQFNRKFDGKEENKFLLDEITADDEISGLFNECVKRYDKVNIEGLNYLATVDEIRELYSDLSDPLQTFLDSATTYDSVSGIIFDEFLKRYNEFLKNKKFTVVTGISLGRLLKGKNVNIKKSRYLNSSDVMTTRNEIFGYCWNEDVGDVTRF